MDGRNEHNGPWRSGGWVSWVELGRRHYSLVVATDKWLGLAYVHTLSCIDPFSTNSMYQDHPVWVSNELPHTT